MEKSLIKQKLREMILATGAERVGFAKAEPVDAESFDKFTQWLAQGRHGGMKYLENYPDIRRDPRLLLDGAKSVISIAFNYYPPQLRDSSLPYISLYAYGQDYHDVIRKRLKGVCEEIEHTWGAQTRICIDSAPILERYWAWRAGLGFQGINGTFILPGRGSYFFLCEIVTTLEIEPNTPIMGNCGGCGRCLRECPTKAILGNGRIDASRCLSYLTIECRDDWQVAPDIDTPLYGCDRCQLACHHNRRAMPTPIEEFHPTEQILTLGYDDIASMTEEDFRLTFRGSAIKRTKHSGLLRNLTKLRHKE